MTDKTPLHIGIVACSAEGASLCYRTICTEAPAFLGGHAHPEVTMHTHSLQAYTDCLEHGDMQGVADLMLASAEKLAAAGADFLICPDNTIHQAFDRVEPRSPRPWLHIADVVAQAAIDRGWRNLALTGTRWLAESDVYPEKLGGHGLRCTVPDADERAEIDRIIMDELVRGISKPESTAYILKVIERLGREGCDAVILGCTEIPLVVDETNAPLPTLDSTRLLARAALHWAVSA